MTTAPSRRRDARVAREHLVGQGRDRARGSGSGRPRPRRRRPSRRAGRASPAGSKRRSPASVAFEIALVGSQRKLSGGQSRTSSRRPYSESAPQGRSDPDPDGLGGAHSITTRIVAEGPVAGAADLAAVGERVGDEVEGGAAEALARQHVGDARRVGGQRLGGDPALGQRRRRPPPAGRGRRRAGSSPAAPRAAAARTAACGSPPSVRSFSAASRRPSSRRAPVAATFSPIPKTATTTFSA